MAFGVTEDFSQHLEKTDADPIPGNPDTPGAGGEENNNLGNEPVVTEIPAAEIPAAEIAAAEVPASTEIPATTIPEINDDAVLAYLNSSGRKVTSIDDLFKPAEAPVNPFEGIEFDDNDKAYLQFKKETGRSYNDFVELHKDLTQVSHIELARERVRKDTGMTLSNQEIDEHLEKQLNITDINDPDNSDKIALAAYVKPELENRKAEQQKYAIPLEKTPPADAPEMITLDNGSVMPKEKYQEYEEIRTTYLENIKTAVDGVAPTVFNFEFDNNGSKEVIACEYVPDTNDKHGMLSDGSDVDATIRKLFGAGKDFDHTGFLTGVRRMDPEKWGKEVTAIVNTAVAQAIENYDKNKNNVNFTRSALPKDANNNGKKNIVPEQKGFGVKHDFS